MSKIVKLTAENVKRLRAVEITTDGNVIVVGGKNGQGKSSVLDSIMYALAGGRSLPKVPVHKGEEKATVEIDLGDLLVKRTFTVNGNTTLTVTNKDGLKYPSPQGILDALVGRLSFDPLEFARQDPKEQSDTLKSVVGIDFTTLDTERQTYYDQRSAINREVKTLEARKAYMVVPVAGLPKEELPAETILAEQRKAAAQNSENAKQRSARDAAKTTLGNLELSLESDKKRVEEIETRLVQAKANLTARQNQVTEARGLFEVSVKMAEKLQDLDLTSFSEKLKHVEATNKQVRDAKAREELVGQIKAKSADADKLTTAIEKIARQKRDEIKAAKFPIAGLSVDETGDVAFNGLPFSQASSAEQLRVSVAIGLALNPKLRVLLIRDGSLLDQDSLALLAKLAADNEAQVWLERVGTEGEVSVMIEDGMVLPPKPEPEEANAGPK